MSDVLAYLSAKGLHLKSAGSSDVHTSCFFCGEDPSKRGRLYINVGTDEQVAGLYMCHRCGEKGNLKTLRKHFGDPPLDAAEDVSASRTAIFNAAAEFYVQQLTTETIQWLKTDRGLTLDTIERHQIGYAPRGDDGSESLLGRHLHNEHGFSLPEIQATGLIMESRSTGKMRDFLLRLVTIPYHAQGQVVQIRGKQVDGKYFTPPGQKARLYNTDGVWNAEEVFLTEGEFDCLILEQQGRVALGVPGAKSWQDSWTGYFDEVRRIYCVFDNDTAGNDGAKKLKDIFGPKLRRVELPTMDDGTKQDVTDWFVNAGATPLQFDELLRSSVLRDSLLISPLEAKVEWDGLQGAKGLLLGWESFDNHMAPGLLPAQVTVVLAKTNTGKTLALLNIFQGVARCHPDAKILFVSLEQTRGDWFERARRIWNFHNIDCPIADVDDETIRFWQPRLRIVDKNRVSEDEMFALLEEYELEMGTKPDLVAVDYLGYWANGFRSKGRYEQVGDAVMSLKAIAKEVRVPIITPHQVSRSANFGDEFSIDSARDSGAVEETADHIIALWSEDAALGKQADQRTGKLNAKIGKSRHGGKGEAFALQFGPVTLAMVDPHDKLRALWAHSELLISRLGNVPWQLAINAHRTGVPIAKEAQDPKQKPRLYHRAEYKEIIGEQALLELEAANATVEPDVTP